MKNEPKLWKAKIPRAKASDTKYSRGYVIVVGGSAEMSGAARLAAISTLRIGAGITRIICPRNAVVAYAKRITSVMVKGADSISEFKKTLLDRRINAIIVGPGCGVNARTKSYVLAAIKSGARVLLDADALTVFERNPEELFKAIKSAKTEVVLTPHEGEFKRLFKLGENRENSVVAAAKKSGAVVLLKGHDTVIANPEGDVIINKDAPENLATAGSGDVLAGIIGGLLAQGLGALDAAAAGAYIHAEAAKLFGRGMISEDLPGLIPKILAKL